MKDVLTAGLYGILSGVFGTGSGGFLACFMPTKNKRFISFVLEYSAGLMLAIICFELLPSAFEFAPLSAVLFGVLAGILIMILSESAINTGSSINRTGMVIALGIGIHNFMEGMAVGSGFEAEKTLGISLAIAIMLHHIPEGISMAVPLRAGGMRRRKVLALTLATGLPMGLGSVFGAWAGQRAVIYIAVNLAVAAGAMLYIVFVDMIPESKRMYTGRFSSIGSIIGMISGIIVSVQLGHP